MAEPQIQFARTNDSVSIAYASIGEGPCVIMVPTAPQSHAERQWHIMPELYQGMAERFHAVWRKGYDRDFEAYAVTAQHPGIVALLRAEATAAKLCLVPCAKTRRQQESLQRSWRRGA